jgi:pre-mRNA-splicing helicase BRR2
MREKGISWILQELAGDRQAKAQPDTMDIDERPEVPRTATLAPGSTLQPKRTVDLESMAFSQGGHLMLNKKCKLPDGSFKRAKKGYEEPGKHLLSRGLTTFKASSTLCTFGTEEPILLCAPTGAG